jgi:hypothetical protein
MSETLVITSIGFENYEVKVSSANGQINAEMVTVESTLGEVVVVGYGTEKKVKSDRCGFRTKRRGAGKPSYGHHFPGNAGKDTGCKFHHRSLWF